MGSYSLLYIRDEKYLQYNTGDAIHTYNQESFFSVGSLSVGLKAVRKSLHALHLQQHGTLGASGVPLCTPSPAKHSCHGGGAGGWHESRCLWRREGLCWDSALNRLQPSPPTPASARASDILLGSPRAAPGCQKQDFAPIKPLSLHSPAMGSFP